jgi:cytidylate kinase
MKVLGSYEKARIYIDRHYQESQEAKFHKRKTFPGPIITISREAGIGAAAICEKLIEYFNCYAIEDYNEWVYFDRSLIEKVMEDHHLPDHFRKFLIEEKTHKADSWIGEMLGVTPSKFSLLNKTRYTILKLAELGNVILVGRGANIITANFKSAFHVRLIAPMNYRIENAMRLYGTSKKNATQFIIEEDNARKNYILKYFHKDISDPLIYHSVINTNLLEFEEIAEIIGHCVIKKFPRFFSVHVNELINEG